MKPRIKARPAPSVAQPPDEITAAALHAGQPERAVYPECPYCGSGWHGLPKDGCLSSLAEVARVVDLRKPERKPVWPGADSERLARIFGPRPYRRAS